LIGEEPGELFEREDRGWSVENWLAQIGWMFSIGKEGGLFVLIGRRD